MIYQKPGFSSSGGGDRPKKVPTFLRGGLSQGLKLGLKKEASGMEQLRNFFFFSFHFFF